MNWLKNIFTTKQPENKHFQNDNTTITDIYLDIDFINFLYFKSTKDNEQHKLENYYTALSVCRFNLHGKIDAQFFDFDFEEILAKKAFKDDFRNYARIETSFMLGEAFLIANNTSKANYYFDIIFNDTYDLSGDTVSKFFRQIGDIYLECDYKTQVLNGTRKDCN